MLKLQDVINNGKKVQVLECDDVDNQVFYMMLKVDNMIVKLFPSGNSGDCWLEYEFEEQNIGS